MEENRTLTKHVMENDNKVIQLQGQLLENRESQLRAVAATVERTAKDSVEKWYSQVASSSAVSHPTQPVISPAMLQRTVKDIANSEERSKNIVVFGLQEQEEENVEARVGEIFEAVGEKPLPEGISRVGKKRTDSHRPILIKFRTAVAASGVLRKSQDLKTNEKFEKVFLSPDRSVAQRVEHRQLVTLMKKRAAEDRSRRFFIRDGQVQSVERDQGAGERGGDGVE